MILDHLDQYQTYLPLGERFQRAFAFLRSNDLAGLADGRHEIQAQEVFALVSRTAGRGKANSPLEAHRRYIDIQFVLAGRDVMGHRPAAGCQAQSPGYDAAKDLVFFVDEPESWLAVPAGQFAIFFPADAHAPLTGEGQVHKVVVKVAV